MQKKRGAWRGPIELLAPAGNMEKLKAAVLYGTDAVYMAGQAFGLRAFSKNFTTDEMFQARQYCTEHGVKMYITCNIMAHPSHMAELDSYINFLKELKPDGVIISDPGVLLRFNELAPELEKHISTQASTTNAQGCLFWRANGAKRIVLARELSLEDIQSIAESIPADMTLEAFVHGAMCMAYSGRCLLSNMLTGRGANQGECAQICRWEYKLIEQKRLQKTLHNGEKPEENYQFSLEEDQHGTYFLSSKDLCMIEHIPEMVEAGITSFKIEGRMKGAYYVAMTIRAYRKALDSYLADPEHYVFEPECLNELKQMTHREYGTGFYFKAPQEQAQVAKDESYQKEATIAGIVMRDLEASEFASPEAGLMPLEEFVVKTASLGKRKQRELKKLELLDDATHELEEEGVLPVGRYALLEERNFVDIGEVLEFVLPRGPILTYQVEALYDSNGRKQARIRHAKEMFYLAIPANWPKLPAGTFVRKKDG